MGFAILWDPAAPSAVALRRFGLQTPAVRCYVVEPASAAVLAGREATHPNHRIQGGGYANRNLPLLQGLQIDGYLQVTDEEAIACARRLCNC
jgi:cysteine synthase A